MPSSDPSPLHPRNRHTGRYDLQALSAAVPELKDYIVRKSDGEQTVDFAKPQAVKLLNRALLKQGYGVEHWDFPDDYLCPPIPGRADYIHYLADLLAEDNGGTIPRGPEVRCLDIGTGASCIYPIIGVMEYGWSFVATDIDRGALHSARKCTQANTQLQGRIDCRLQTNPQHVLHSILDRDEYFDLTLCNPPFHASASAAARGTRRKLRNLHQQTPSGEPLLNFSGRQHELVYPGGEVAFLSKLIQESRTYARHAGWFSSFVSRRDHLPAVQRALKKAQARRVQLREMGTSNKQTRIIAWSFN